MSEDLTQQGVLATGSEAPGGSAAATSTPGAPGATPGSVAAAEPLHEIKWNGQTQKLPLSKVLELAQKGYDYTQKSQQLSGREREWQGRLSQYERAIGEVRQFLQDRAKVKAYYDAMAGSAAGDPAGAGDPADLLTAQQAQELLRRQASEQRQEIARELARMREEINISTMAAGYGEKLNSTISGLMQSHPELRTIPRIQKILKEEVAERNPGSLEEAQSLLAEVASMHAEGVRSFFAEQSKAQAVGAAPLARGIEPPGSGSAPPPAPAAQTPKNMNSKEFRDLVLADLQGAFKRDA